MHEMNSIVNAMSVDVEDYFQVSAFEKVIDRDAWDKVPCRVESNTDQILGLFDECNTKATFFTLGWVAERYPALIKKIVAQGHELASHGYSHIRVTQQDPKSFREDVVKTRALLEDISGRRVRGYRAASYSINASNLWAMDVLKEAGYEYSSSIYPVKHDIYGMPDSPRFPYHHQGNELLEIPISTYRIMQKNYPCGGGGYFRLYPYALSRWAIKTINSVEQRPCVFYFHPWEIDPEQPRQSGLSLKTRFRHYLNLRNMQTRLRALMRDFSWDRMDRVYLKNLQND